MGIRVAKRCSRAYIGRFTDQDGNAHRVHAERQGDKIEGYRWQVLGDDQDAECSGKTFGEAVKAACDAWPEMELGEVAGDALRRYLA